MTLTTRIFTRFCGELVGEDAKGNRYYQQKKVKKGEKQKRWVLYHGAVEASSVSPDWHGWLHYTTNTPPNKQHRAHYGWEKPPLANQTGSSGAYLPPGHLSKGGNHAPTAAAYQAWKP